MTDRRRIEYRSDLDTREFERGARTMRDRFRDMGQGLQDLGVVGFGQLSQAMGYSARDLVDMGVRFVRGAAEAAVMGENIRRVGESFNTIFGPAARGLRDTLDETRRSMALSRSEMESMLLPMGQMATNAGFAADTAAELSGRLLTMAGDVAAFNPLIGDANQALGAMQAALRGEFDPLERFGSKLSAARVQAEATRLRGIDPMNESLTDQQLQIMAVVSLLEADFAPALGSLERAEGTAADTMNELTAAWKDGQEAGYLLANQTLAPLLTATADLIEQNAQAASSGDILGQTFRNIGTGARTVLSPALAAVNYTLGIMGEEARTSGGGVRRHAEEQRALAAEAEATADALRQAASAQMAYRQSIIESYAVAQTQEQWLERMIRKLRATQGYRAPWADWGNPPSMGGYDPGSGRYVPPESAGRESSEAGEIWDYINGAP